VEVEALPAVPLTAAVEVAEGEDGSCLREEVGGPDRQTKVISITSWTVS